MKSILFLEYFVITHNTNFFQKNANAELPVTFMGGTILRLTHSKTRKIGALW